MATLNNILAIHVSDFTNTTDAADRTFTATRQLRVFDAKFLVTDAVAGGAAASFTVKNGSDTIVTAVSGDANAVAKTVYRLGAIAGGANTGPTNTLDDAHAVVSKGGTVVVESANANTARAVVYCYPL